MNPGFFFRKTALRFLGVLAIAGTLFLATACGSGNGSIGGGGGGGNNGFSNASLNGQYVFSQKGFAETQDLQSTDFFSEAGVFTADGSGHLTNIIDDFAQSGVFFPGANNPLSGTYHVNNDGSGLLTFNFGGGSTSNFRITLSDAAHFYMVELDSFATSSGSGEKQSTTVFNPAATDNFIFSGHDIFTSSVRVGSMSFNAGAIAGVEDLLVNGGSFSSPTFTGNISQVPDANGRGALTLSDGSVLEFYVVSSSRFRLLSSTGSLEVGVGEKQTGAPFSKASLAAGNSYVFGSAGETTVAAGIHSAGIFTTDGNGGVTGGATDFVQDGNVFSDVAVQNTSDYSLASNGRGVLNVDLASNGTNQKIFWMVDSTRAYFLVNSAATIEDGTLILQKGAPFAGSGLSAQSAFFMDGFDAFFKDRVGTITPDGKGSLNWSHEANSFDPSTGIGLLSTFSTNGTYQLSANGRATVTVNDLLGNGVNSSMVFYLVSNNTGYMVQEDQGFDIGGAFNVQTKP